MKKILVVFGVLMLAMVASATNTTQTIKWSEVKPILDKAIKTNVRADVDVTWEQFYPQLSSDIERAEMVKLFLLGQQGSYSDLVLMALDEYLVLYDRQIKSAVTNQQRQQYFKKELEGLANIFTTLNYQVRTYQAFNAQSKKDFATYLGHFPATEADWRNWSSFLYSYPQYQIAPGFWSYTLESGRGSRSWDNYFQHELQQVQIELKELPAEVAVVYYQSVLKNFSGVLKNDLVK